MVRAGESLMKLVSDLKQYLILNDFPSVNDAIASNSNMFKEMQVREGFVVCFGGMTGIYSSVVPVTLVATIVAMAHAVLAATATVWWVGVTVQSGEWVLDQQTANGEG